MSRFDSKAFISDLVKRGYVLIGDKYYPPNSKEAKEHITAPVKKPRLKRTGGIDDDLNIRNKSKTDTFIQLIKIELNIEVWPEFYFSTERNYRLDYALPLHKIAVEVDGGIYAKGNSGHSSGTGIKRDQEKASLLASLGWLLIRVTPGELLTGKTIELIKKAQSFRELR